MGYHCTGKKVHDGDGGFPCKDDEDGDDDVEEGDDYDGVGNVLAAAKS